MSRLLLAGLCGFLGAAVALVVALAFLVRQLKGSQSVTFSRGANPEFYKEVQVLEHSPRPQGLYVRFRNSGAKPIEMANFKVRGYKDGKLWAEFEEGAYCETQPGREQEAILKLQDYRDPGKSIDLSDCRVEVEFLYGFVIKKEPA